MNKVNVNKMAFWVFNFTYLNCVCNVYGHVNVINIKNRPMKAVLIVKNIWGFCLLPHFLLCVLGVFPFFKKHKGCNFLTRCARWNTRNWTSCLCIYTIITVLNTHACTPNLENSNFSLADGGLNIEELHCIDH